MIRTIVEIKQAIGAQGMKDCFHQRERGGLGESYDVNRMFKTHGPRKVITNSRYSKARGTGEGKS